ncbi:MAG: Unknown protein [uncultured Campylobacterales bacterium]|uniref:Uncharacterized protein n=1 Tax=uncultured Campylobacterales bacterium TaxID=352960 RepID=A0A6S6T640_9BACT|nr:MAG: Unknown protein [uncultured Campylobacterales bacterium]
MEYNQDNFFEKEINNQQKMINEKLESYNSSDFFFKLHRLIRTIEEFIIISPNKYINI